MTADTPLDGSEDVIWTARGLHHYPEVVHGPAHAARPSTARQYVAVDTVNLLLREVSRDYAGAHVNAGSVTGSVRRRLKELTDAGQESRDVASTDGSTSPLCPDCDGSGYEPGRMNPSGQEPPLRRCQTCDGYGRAPVDGSGITVEDMPSVERDMRERATLTCQWCDGSGEANNPLNANPAVALLDWHPPVGCPRCKGTGKDPDPDQVRFPDDLDDDDDRLPYPDQRPRL